ncbi:U1 zinc finger domain-containing protein [Zopfia rhizophila CBS 207.26]|uniref:U1 zinc finger domain-containing protein n=1 Tax=Zopfia rhizophila CBS 207.26 TaxID=1314779 RepID=A0A6A6DUV4_9PEZI|nr:U1 zinc finger domain-containing protein [Zopfia rhizophila CBS 207.26]
MAEYWKSTPKYWCKFCSVFVKDTKFERAQHEATGRHQGNIQRSLRGLHKEQEQEERKKQRAKDEVARLNTLVPGSGSAAPSGDARVGATPTFTREKEKKATLDDRKRQMEQLAAMGVAVPEDFRRDMAMAGDWQVVSEKLVSRDERKEGEPPLNVGVHKRKLDEAEEEALAAGEIITKKKGWGQTFKTFPGSKGGDTDLDVLFKKVKNFAPKEEAEAKAEPQVKEESEVKGEAAETALQDIPTEPDTVTRNALKAEEEDGNTPRVAPAKAEDGAAEPVVVFKKRKKAGR